jgi:vitamin B12 transporter
MRKSLKTFILLSFLSLTTVAFGQVTVTGKVMDKKKALAGASITLKDTYDGATADSTGKFTFKTTEKGEHTLVITSIGFMPHEQKIKLEDKGTLNVDIVMKEEITELQAVVLSAGTFEASDRKRAAVVLDPIDIVTTASANADVTQALKTLPGAQQVGESEGLFVRGGTAAETKIFIDGTLVNRFFYSSSPNVAGYGRFSPFIFKGTVFSTGGYSALYGQALSSAVILESIDLPERSSGNVGFSVLSANGGYQHLGKKKDHSWGVDYNFTHLGLAFAVLKQEQDYFKNPVYHDVNANFRIKTSKTGMLKYYANFSNGRFGFDVPSLDSAGFYDMFQLKNTYLYQNIAWKETLPKKWRVNLGVSYTYNIDDIHGGMRNENKTDVLVAGLEDKNFQMVPVGNYANAKLVLEKRLRGLSAIRFGTEYNYSHDNALFTRYTGEKYRTTIREHIKSFFTEADVYITNALAAKIGARMEHSSSLDKVNVAPRLSLAYKTGKNSQASVAYGIFYQNPETRYLPSPNALDYSKATHYIAQYQITGTGQVFRAELFYKKYDRLIKTGLGSGGSGQALNNNGFGDAKGFEFFWRDKKTIKDFDYWISYSFLDTKRDFLNFPYAITPNFAAKHTASLIVKKFVMPWKTGFNGAYNYSSGRPYYNITYNGTEYEFSDMGRIPDYHNVSFSVNYIPSIGKQDAKGFTVFVLSVNNILNIKQTYGYQYSYNAMRKKEIVPPSRMFVFFGVFISFGIDRTQEAIDNNL